MANRLDTSLKATIQSLAGGGGGGYNNMLYFDAPGSWTSPASLGSSNQIKLNSGTQGGGGAGGGFGATNTAGGNGTPSIFGPLTITLNNTPFTPVGAGTGQNGADSKSQVNPFYLFDKLQLGDLKNIVSGGAGGTSVRAGGKGGDSSSFQTSIALATSTVYPISVGQGGGGGGGSAGKAGGGGGAGGGPVGGGAGAPPAQSSVGSAGGLMPLSLQVPITGFNGSNGIPSGLAPEGGGAGGGSGQHGFIIFYF